MLKKNRELCLAFCFMLAATGCNKKQLAPVTQDVPTGGGTPVVVSPEGGPANPEGGAPQVSPAATTSGLTTESLAGEWKLLNSTIIATNSEGETSAIVDNPNFQYHFDGVSMNIQDLVLESEKNPDSSDSKLCAEIHGLREGIEMTEHTDVETDLGNGSGAIHMNNRWFTIGDESNVGFLVLEETPVDNVGIKYKHVFVRSN